MKKVKRMSLWDIAERTVYPNYCDYIFGVDYYARNEKEGFFAIGFRTDEGLINVTVFEKVKLMKVETRDCIETYKYNVYGERYVIKNGTVKNEKI